MQLGGLVSAISSSSGSGATMAEAKSTLRVDMKPARQAAQQTHRNSRVLLWPLVAVGYDGSFLSAAHSLEENPSQSQLLRTVGNFWIDRPALVFRLYLLHFEAVERQVGHRTSEFSIFWPPVKFEEAIGQISQCKTCIQTKVPIAELAVWGGGDAWRSRRFLRLTHISNINKFNISSGVLSDDLLLYISLQKSSLNSYRHRWNCSGDRSQ